ncbi:glycosyltransferase family 2 protein [Phenylobacterium sp.]|uniref:glycosyltransferase family 2 protein n=1 Tax=Phenylobacterium sp. TaxID=1871053 RepID=UPI003563B3F6
MARSGGKPRSAPGIRPPGVLAETGPAVSVIMPVRNGAHFIVQAIEGLRRSTFSSYELIVVDDASSDGSGEVAAAMDAIVIRPEQWGGPVAARTAGIARARGSILAFVDADVVVHPDALARIVERLAAEPQTAAIFGAYDDAPSAPAVLSRFRNLLHTYVHRRGSPDAQTFWTGLGAVRREAFDAIGGFAGVLLDDVEFGVRLSGAGYRIVLDTSIQGGHLKDWTLPLMVRTDVVMRGAPWIRLALERGFFRNDLNTSAGQRASVAAVGAFLALIAMGALSSGWPFVASAAGAGLALSVTAWGDADRTPLRGPSAFVLILASLAAAGGLLLAGARPAALAVIATAIIRILGRPGYGPRTGFAGWLLAAAAASAVGLSIAAAPPSAWGLAALAVAALYIGLSWPILRFMGSRMGLAGGLAALPLLFVYHLSCGLAVVLGVAGYLVGRRGPAPETAGLSSKP